MKATVFAVIFAVLGTLAFAQVNVADGWYFAQEKSFPESGWKDQVVLRVENHKIVQLHWNSVNNLGLADKVTVSSEGHYGLEKASKLKLRWDQQAQNTVNYVLKTQDLAGKFTKDGRADGISGASIHVVGFFALINEALKAGPVAKGPFQKDGWFYQQASEFDPKTGWKDNVLVTVVNGTIVDVVWNSLNKDPKMKSKILESEAGHYGMEKVAKQGPWHVQAQRVDDAIVKAGDPAKIAVKANGTTDAISGATFHVVGVSLAVDALKAAR